MNFKRNLLFFCTILTFKVFSQSISAQSESPTKVYHCGTEIPPASWDTWFNAKVIEFKSTLAMEKNQRTSLTIPVIVHVIHGGEAIGTYPNISQSQIKSQITVLNKDFSGTGYNVYQLATKGFSTVGAANCMVSFCLAESDPNGNPLAEPGIERINYVTKGWTNPASPVGNTNFKNLIDGTVKPNSIWDPTAYFNIWVTDINSSNDLLGYATFPNGSGLTGIPGSVGTAITDGIWCFAKSFGSTGTLLSGYNLGRTATHEVGHWLGLRHIGGDASNPAGDCNATDYCDDTPAQRGGYASGSNGQNFGNPPYPLNAFVCSSEYGDMFMNFMDYTYDYSKYMYTPDQADRIQTAMANGFFRSQLNASSANLCSGRPNADFSIDTLACMDAEVNILNLSEGFPLPTYSWTVKPIAGAVFTPTHTSSNPKISYTEAGTYTISVTITNSVGVSTATYEQRVMDCTGLPTQSKGFDQFTLFPNPSKGHFSVRTSLQSGAFLSFTVFNSFGEKVLENSAIIDSKGELAVDLSSFPQGVYAITLTNQHEKVSKRLILSQ